MSTRTFVSFSFVLSLVSVAGCGSDDTTTPPTPPADTATSDSDSTTGDSGTDSAKPDGGDDSSVDTTTSDDTTPSGDSGIACGTTTCTGGDICCATPKEGGVDFACAKACSDGGVPLSCDGPEDCSGSTAICCGTLTVGPGTVPSCPIKSAAASCKSTCTTSIAPSCDTTNTVRLCHKKSDCAADTANANCCQFATGTTSATFCVSDLIKTLAGTSATCF